MLEVKVEVTVKAPELTEAIRQLAAAKGGPAVAASITPVAPAAPAAPATNPAAAVTETAPVMPTPLPVAPAAPAATAKPATQPQQYTLEQLSTAAARLVDAGKMPQILAAIQKYGVQAVNQISPAVYPQFAADLRALGAAI